MTTWSTWTERQIAARVLSPGARGMTPEAAAEQSNRATGLGQSDPDYLYAPSQAQQTARDLLAHVGITVDDDTTVVLTDCDDTGRHGREHRINPGQIAGAAEEHRLCTGDNINPDALIQALPWSEPQW